MSGLKWIAVSVLLATLFVTFGCSQQAKQANDPRTEGTFILYSLDGDRYPGDPVPEGAVLLHGWPILKECPIESDATRHKLFAALDAGIEDASDIGSDMVPDCFNPHHAIRVETEEVAVDYVICFKCWQYVIWQGDKQVSGGITSAAPKKTFDAVLVECAEKKGSG